MKLDRVIIFHAWGVGDWIIFSPVIRALVQMNPDILIDVIASNKSVIDLVPKYPNCRIIGELNRDRFFLNFHNLKLLFGLKKIKYSAAIFSSGMSSRKSDFIASFVNSDRRVALLTKGHYQPFFLSNRSRYDDSKSHLENTCLLMRELNLEGPKELYIPSPKKVQRHPKSLLVHPGSDKGNPYKRWAIENYVLVANRLLIEGWKVGILLGPQEKEYENDFAKINNDILIHKDLDFDSLLMTMSGYEGFLNNDSGMGHVAAALGLKIVSLFGPTDPKLYLPFASDVVALQSELDLKCRPCYNLNPKSFGCVEKTCMTSITVDLVIFKILKIFNLRF